jgi:putative tryptophan/tyrosine transport system substrate-binding protein
MKRRDFIVGISAVATWSVAAPAQQAAIPIIGFLHGGSREENFNRLAAFRKGLSAREMDHDAIQLVAS